MVDVFQVMQAMMQMQSNPAAAMQYMSDPEVGPILMKVAATLGGSMGGMGGTSAAAGSTAPAGSTVDIDEVD